MAKYRLMQDKEEIKFTQTPDFSDLNIHSLKDIIKFTGVFKNADELKEYLNKYKLIKTNKPLNIKYRFGGKDNTLRYGLSYQDSLKFFNVHNMVEFLGQNRFNIGLLETLCNHYRNSYVNGGNILEIRRYISLLKKEQSALDDESEIVKDFHYAIGDFINRECYRYDKQKNIYKDNFKGMRDLAMFLAYQTTKDESLRTYDMNNSNEFIEYYKNKILVNTCSNPIEEIHIEDKPKTKKKSKKDFPGQMSFIINDGNVDI